jgi:hypothetical protein
LVVAILRGHAKYAEFLLDKDAKSERRPGVHTVALGGRQFDHQLSDYSNGILSDNTGWVRSEGYADGNGWNL